MEYKTKEQLELEKSMKESIEKGLNLDIKDPNLKETPARIAKMYVKEIFSSLFTKEPKCTVFPNDKNYDQLITGSFTSYSTCSHHFVPFKMKVHIGYLPDKYLFGLSKLARITDYFANKPQLQENLTEEIADYIIEKSGANGCIVFIEGEHMCTQMRGVKKPDMVMKTTAIRKAFKDDPYLKDEFYKMVRR